MKCPPTEHEYEPYPRSRALYCTRCGDSIEPPGSSIPGRGRRRRKAAEPLVVGGDAPQPTIADAEAEVVRQMQLEFQEGDEDVLDDFASQIMEPRSVPVDDDEDDELGRGTGL